MMLNSALVFLTRHFVRKNTKLKEQVKQLQESEATAAALARKYEAALTLAELEIQVAEHQRRLAVAELATRDDAHGTKA